MNPCQLCKSEFPGPLLLKRHMQVRHKPQMASFTGGDKRKSSFTECSVSLKQRLDEIPSNLRKDFVQANVEQSSSPTLFQKIEQFKGSNNHAAETAFNATFTKKDKIASSTERLSIPSVKESSDSALKCNYCEYQARSATGLTRHTTGHTGARKCSKCNKGYAQGSSSSEHYLKQHEASCNGDQKWFAASVDNQKAPSSPPLLRNEKENPTLPVMRTEYSDQPPQLSVEVKSEDLKPTPMVSKEEVPARNIKFEAYISSQVMNNFEEVKPVVPLYIYNKPQEPLQPLQPLQPIQPQQDQGDGLTETAPEKKPQERTQFGPKG